jgi:hypothetical protein
VLLSICYSSTGDRARPDGGRRNYELPAGCSIAPSHSCSIWLSLAGLLTPQVKKHRLVVN